MDNLTMNAVVLNGITSADDVKITQCKIPEVVSGWVLIKIKAFGLNHSESILRLSEINADYIQKPIIPGIVCAGEVADASDTNFKIGQKVVALMGGMGRSYNGSYAQYALIPADHVFAVDTCLPWVKLGAIPETYFTAWGSLFECLNLKPAETLLVRGATCSLGYAAIQIAKSYGCRVIATTHKKEKLQLLDEVGADMALLDEGILYGKIKADKALELVGPKTLRDTMRCVKRGGIVCNTGILGGVYYLNGFDPIKEIPNGVYLTGFFSNYPSASVIKEMVAFIEKHNIEPKIAKVFHFDDIKEAVKLQDNGGFDGKIVIEV
ncbi:MAG: zinc-binding dehydrogenase [Clostridia bacterium]|nr:zinc-binding dehydrogenase [Clostridia bacterium]